MPVTRTWPGWGRFYRLLALSACGLALLCRGPAAAAAEYREVDAKDLVQNAKNYWSLGVVFRDTLTQRPGGDTIRIGDKRYVRFGTKLVGDCYAEEALLPRLDGLPVEQDYLFRGMVLNRPSTFGFKRRATFCIVVQSLTAAITDAVTADVLDEALATTPSTGKPSADLVQILSSVHASLSSYAEENHVEMSDLFQEGSEHAAATADLINSTILAAQRESETSPNEIIARFVRDTLARRYSAPPAAEEAAPGTEPLEGPAAEMTPPSELAPTEVAAAATPQTAIALKAGVVTETARPPDMPEGGMPGTESEAKVEEPDTMSGPEPVPAPEELPEEEPEAQPEAPEAADQEPPPAPDIPLEYRVPVRW